MIPVDQTVFGKPNGNCFDACIASLLELPLGDVAHFNGEDGTNAGNDTWFTALERWLRPRGFYPVCIKCGDWLPLGWHILSGKSPRGDFPHSVIRGPNYERHDPHPSRDWIETEDDIIILVPIDPASVNSPASGPGPTG